MEYISDLRAFLKVVEKQNFSGAAAALGMSQSAVSKRISRLESSLGVQLLKRSTRHLAVTEAGAEFHAHAERILIALDEAQRSTASAQATLSGRLRVHSTLGLGQSLMAPAVAEFIARHPDVAVDLVLAPSNTINLIHQDVDVTIRLSNEREALQHSSSVDRRIIGSVRYLICAAPSYFARAGLPRTPQALAEHNCLILAIPPSADLWHFNGPKGTYAVRVTGNFSSNSGSALYDALIQGAGIAKVLEYAAADDLAQGRLQAIFADATEAKRFLLAYYPRSATVPKRIELFLDFLSGYLARKLGTAETGKQERTTAKRASAKKE